MNYATAEAEDNREKILKFIVKYIKRHCYPPATYEIAADTGLSKATVRRHIAMLLEDRILETEPVILRCMYGSQTRKNMISSRM